MHNRMCAVHRIPAIRERILDPSHPHMAETLEGFASLREAQNNLQEAASLYQRALAIREHAPGQCHPKTEETRTHYLALLRAMGG